MAVRNGLGIMEIKRTNPYEWRGPEADVPVQWVSQELWKELTEWLEQRGLASELRWRLPWSADADEGVLILVQK